MNEATKPKRVPVPHVLVADDHHAMREMVRALLDEQFDVVGEAEDGERALDMARELEPDVVVLDIGMPHVDGLEACRTLKRRFREMRIVIVTMHEEPELAVGALRAGAQAFLLKTDGARVFAEALAAALRDETYVSPTIRDEVARLMGKQASPRSLTPRQREILTLLARGLAMKQVALELDITPRTVAFHKYRIMERYELDSSAGLVRLAIQEGLVAPPSKPTTSQ